MKKIAFFQSDLNVGGIQKSIITLLNNLDDSLYEVDLFLFSEADFFEKHLPENVRIIRMKPFPKYTKLFPFSLVRKLYGKTFASHGQTYDVAVDFNSYWHECSVGAVSVPAKKRVMWIHNDVEKKLAEDPKYRMLWRAFKTKFRYFDEFAAVSAGIIPGFRRAADVHSQKIVPIPNFIDTTEIFEKSRETIHLEVDPTKVNLISVGRLCHQKGYDLLIDAYAKVLSQRKDLHLYLIGDGPDRKELEQQITRLGIGEHITLLGNQPNPFPYEKRMDAFVLTSRYEGQGIVLWEAKCLGLQILMTKNLEKYNKGIAGCSDITEAMLHVQKQVKKEDPLEEYNADIRSAVEGLLS